MCSHIICIRECVVIVDLALSSTVFSERLFSTEGNIYEAKRNGVYLNGRLESWIGADQGACMWVVSEFVPIIDNSVFSSILAVNLTRHQTGLSVIDFDRNI